MANKKGKKGNEPILGGRNDNSNANRNAEDSSPIVENSGKAKKKKKQY